MDNLPLTGLQIVELPSGLAGAYCGRLFSQYGAQVTKINPLNFQSNDLSKNFEYLNTGKKIVHYNFNSSKQRRCINSIIQNCDLIIFSYNNLPEIPKFTQTKPNVINKIITEIRVNSVTTR